VKESAVTHETEDWGRGVAVTGVVGEWHMTGGEGGSGCAG